MPSYSLQIMKGGLIPLGIAGVREVELISPLGTGGFSSVWKAINTDTRELYALKIIQNITPGSVDERRVRLEAGVAIDSEYILEVFGLCEWNEQTFLILFEYCEGTSLEKLLEESTLSNAQKKAIFIQILRGVAAAHQHNIIHRDLKPGNVLVGQDGKVKLIDFGISKFKGVSITKSSDFLGTIAYTAPELMNLGAEVADARCDIYSLGHILYELAMGVHFWRRRDWETTDDLIQYLDQVPPPTEAIDLSDFHCDFFPNARKVLAHMVKREVEERYKTVNDILRDLGETPVKIVAPPVEPEEPLSNILPISAEIDLHSPLLIVESGANRLARTVLALADEEKRQVGRSDLAGSDASISRTHLEISRQGNHYYIRDLGSKNGTMVHGILLKRGGRQVELHHNDHVKVGDIFLRFAFLKR